MSSFGATAAIGRRTSPASPSKSASTQRDFLGGLGIIERATALAQANPARMDEIGAALKRLTAPEEMGTLFKVFCAHSGDLEPLGFPK